MGTVGQKLTLRASMLAKPCGIRVSATHTDLHQALVRRFIRSRSRKNLLKKTQGVSQSFLSESLTRRRLFSLHLEPSFHRLETHQKETCCEVAPVNPPVDGRRLHRDSHSRQSLAQLSEPQTTAIHNFLEQFARLLPPRHSRLHLGLWPRTLSRGTPRAPCFLWSQNQFQLSTLIKRLLESILSHPSSRLLYNKSTYLMEVRNA